MIYLFSWTRVIFIQTLLSSNNLPLFSPLFSLSYLDYIFQVISVSPILTLTLPLLCTDISFKIFIYNSNLPFPFSISFPLFLSFPCSISPSFPNFFLRQTISPSTVNRYVIFLYFSKTIDIQICLLRLDSSPALAWHKKE